MGSYFWFQTGPLNTLRGHRLLFPNKIVFLSLKIVFVLVIFKVNGVDPGEMSHSVACHLGLHCLSKYAFRSH